MNCHDIQQKLSAYIEGLLPPEEKVLIDKHLITCPNCNESLADLRKTIDYVKNLEDVEPPAWLTQKVITRIKAEIEPKKGILQKLFSPLHIKLPLEAVAVIFIAFTALYIFKTIQPEVKLARAPSEKVTTLFPSEEREPFKKEAESKEEVTPLSPPLENMSKKGVGTEQPITLKKPEAVDILEKVPQAPAPVVKQEEESPATGTIAKDESKTGVLSRAEKAKSLTEKKEAYSLTIHVNDIKTAGKEVEKALIQVEGRITKTESLEDKEIITAELDSTRLKGLIMRLENIGEVEEKEGVTGTHKGLEIRIEIVQ